MNNLKRERKKHDMSVEQVADIIGVHPNTVSAWESGRWEPTGKNLVQLASLFGCSADYLLEMGDDE